jgi:asparaginyl-tRNA synthetase
VVLLALVLFLVQVFIRDYPKDIKAFYMKLNPDGRTVAATDLIVPGVWHTLRRCGVAAFSH